MPNLILGQRSKARLAFNSLTNYGISVYAYKQFLCESSAIEDVELVGNRMPLGLVQSRVNISNAAIAFKFESEVLNQAPSRNYDEELKEILQLAMRIFSDKLLSPSLKESILAKLSSYGK